MTYGGRLFPQHVALLEASGIDPEVAEARGYVSADTKAQLGRLGFNDKQQLIPALVIPIYNVRGRIATYQCRPDKPRWNDEGDPTKYETPMGASVPIDVHPSIVGQLSDPSIPLWITEGSRKADSAISRGLCCVSLLGVWGWQKRSVRGAAIPLEDWDAIALQGREVHVAFDSDVTTKRQVQSALRALSKFLAAAGAKVNVVQLPGGPDGEKVGLDDFLATHSLEELLALSPAQLSEQPRPTTWVDSYTDLPFPLEVYPPVLQQFIQQTATSVCVHPDMLAVMMLPVMATAIGSSRVLGVKDDWLEAPRLWAAVVADPGGKKSPAQKRALAGLELIQQELDNDYRLAVEQWKGTAGMDEPHMKQITGDDVTIEVLARMLQQHPRGILLDKDELASWVKGFGEYKSGRGADRDRWLSMWNGKRISINRVNLGKVALIVPRPFISIVGGIQPERVGSLIDKAGDDGLIYRLLFSCPPDVEESARTPAVSKSVQEEWPRICQRLYRLQPDEDGTPRMVRSTLGGKNQLFDQLQRIYDEKRAPEMPPAVRGFWGKGDAHLLRLATVLACLWAVCEDATEEVTPEIAEYAAMVNDYFKGQALRLFGAEGVVRPREYDRVGPQLANKVLTWMQQGHAKTTRRELMVYGPLQHLPVKDVETLLWDLEARGRVNVSEGGRGRVLVELSDLS